MGKGAERDLYDGKRLPSRLAPVKQFIPAVLACIVEMKRHWNKPFSHCVPVKGFAWLDIQDMGELGLADPPPVELSVANHLRPGRRAAFSSAGTTLPGKTEQFSTSTFQKIYKSSALAIPALWEEICVIADVNLRNPELQQEYGAGCGGGKSVMARSLWPF